MPGEELLQQPRGEVLGVRQQRVLWTKRDHFAGSFPWSPQDCWSLHSYTAQLHSTATQVATSMMWGEWEGPSPWSYSGSSRVEGSLVSCPIILPVGTQMRRICTREPRTMSWWSDSDIIGSPSFLHCNSTSLRLTHVPFECANRGRTLRGIMANHSGLCLTVFSASNYCGSVGAMVATGCRCNWNAGIWCTLPFFLLNLRQSRRCSRAATVNEKAPFQQWLWSDYW